VIAELLNNHIVMGMAQAAGAIMLCAAVVLLCRWFAVHVERETAISVARGLVQMVFVGMVLSVLLRGNLLVGVLVLLAMTLAAAVTASRRVGDIKGSLLLCRALQSRRHCTRGPDRGGLGARCRPRRDSCALCAGCGLCQPPRLDMLKSLGLVWIPGVMAGMMVSGASPIYAGIYQFIIVAMILAASGIAG
jgi:putative ABC transport system permease protein